MRIIECINSLEAGGAQRLLVDLSNELSNTDEVVVLTLKNRKELKEDFYLPQISGKVQFLSLNLSDGFHISYPIRIYKTIKRLRPDVVHIHCIVHYFLFAILFYRKACYVQTLHNEAEHGIVRYFRNIWKWLLKMEMLHVVTISQTNRESFQTFFNLTCDILIYNGRKQPSKSKCHNVVTNFVKQLKKHPDDLLLLSIARGVPQKNIGMLISAVNELAEKGRHLQLLLIGDYESNELGRQWMSMAGSTVHFLGVKDNIADYLYSCDAFCLSSLYEGMPIALIEALACRCIPICTPCSGVVDVVKDGVTGFIAPSFSKEDYKQTILDFLQNRERIDKEKLYNTYLSMFSIELCSSQYMQLFRHLLIVE